MHAINAMKVMTSEQLDRSQHRLLRHPSINMMSFIRIDRDAAGPEERRAPEKPASMNNDKHEESSMYDRMHACQMEWFTIEEARLFAAFRGHRRLLLLVHLARVDHLLQSACIRHSVKTIT